MIKLIIIVLLVLLINLIGIKMMDSYYYNLYRIMLRKVIIFKLNEIYTYFKNILNLSNKGLLILLAIVSIILFIVVNTLYIILLPILSVLIVICIYFKWNTFLIYVDCMVKSPGHKIKNMGKIGWFKVFTNYNINTPRVYAYTQYGNLTVIDKDFNKDKKYIIKLNDGVGGFFLTIGTYNEFVKKNKFTILKYLFQEIISDCNYKKKPRHVRLITRIDKNNNIETVTYMIEIGKSFSRPNSNGLNKENVYDCLKTLDGCSILTKEEKASLKDIADKLKLVHKRELMSIYNIGWDIILTCDGPYVLEGNMCSGLGSAFSRYTLNKYLNY